MKHKLTFFLSAVLVMLVIGSCQKMKKPALGDYPADSNPPTGPLVFYAAFDGTSTNPLMNAVDSIRANFPSDNPLQSVDGIKGKAVQGASKKFIKYPNFNSWTGSSSFTLSSWFKKDGQTKNNVGGNGPEYIFSIRASEDNYHWSNAIMFVFLEGDNAACAVKVQTVSPSDPANPGSSASDNWFTWEGGQTIPGLLNNAWHHMVLTYDATTSSMRLYIDGVVNPNVKTWANHGAIRLSTTKIGEYRVGRGPRNDNEGDGEAGWLQSSFKGSLDQFRLYSKALTAAEVQALFASKL